MYFYIGTLFSLEVNRWYVYMNIGSWVFSIERSPSPLARAAEAWVD